MARVSDPAPGSRVQVRTRSIMLGPHRRTWLEARPTSIRQGAALVLVFHGSNQTGDIVRYFTGFGFDHLAERENLIVAYPDGYRRRWHDGRVSLGLTANRSTRDVDFIEELVEHYTSSGAVDPARVYAVGYSSGGYFVFRLIHEHPELFAGGATISATHAVPTNYAGTDAAGAVPMLLIHGNQDPVVKYRGFPGRLNTFRPGGGALSHRETAEYFATRNGITVPFTEQALPDVADKGTSAIQRDFAEPGRPAVRSITIVGGGHTVPNLVYTAPRVVGRTNSRLDTAAATWQFFSGA